MDNRWQDYLEQYKYKLIIGTVVFFCLIIVCVGFFKKVTSKESENKMVPEINTSISVKKESKVDNKNNIYVDIKGSVKNQGVYKLSFESRIDKLIAIAGGINEDADLNKVNLAKILKDEEVIYIPKKGEKIPAEFEKNIQDGVSQKEQIANTNQNVDSKINLNTATKEQLQTLTGVGPSKAEAILNYKKTSGDFKVIEDLKNVDGIGEKTFDKLKDLITV